MILLSHMPLASVWDAQSLLARKPYEFAVPESEVYFTVRIFELVKIILNAKSNYIQGALTLGNSYRAQACLTPKVLFV